jgi:hypothetical protein
MKSGDGIYVLSMAWTTDGSGNFTATDTAYNIDGYVLMVETDPDGTAVPSADYDITLKTANGADVMGGALADRSATDAELALPIVSTTKTSVPVVGKLTFDVTGAGNDKKGVLNIYYSKCDCK